MTDKQPHRPGLVEWIAAKITSDRQHQEVTEFLVYHVIAVVFFLVPLSALAALSDTILPVRPRNIAEQIIEELLHVAPKLLLLVIFTASLTLVIISAVNRIRRRFRRKTASR